MSSPDRGIAILACVLWMVLPSAVHADITEDQGLNFGVFPPGTSPVTVAYDASTAGLYTIVPEGTYCNSAGGTIYFNGGYPTQLKSGGNTISVSNFDAKLISCLGTRDFQSNGTLTLSDSDMDTLWLNLTDPITVRVGAQTGAPTGQALGTYSDNLGVLHFTYERLGGGGTCNRNEDLKSGANPVVAAVDAGMEVTVTNSPIDLGVVFMGSPVLTVAYNDTLGRQAKFSVVGPTTLNWTLALSDTDLKHETSTDTCQLTFGGGAYGTGTGDPTNPFTSGATVMKNAHGGGPLNVWVGYTVDFSTATTEGKYTGMLTLTVEAMIN